MFLPLCASALWGEVREAIAYLEREVPKWERENRCYSCHNNGDGLRALLTAHRAGMTVDRKVLEDSVVALKNPGKWEQKPLVRVQIAAAAREAKASGMLDRAAFEAAVDEMARDQQPDGHWKVEEELAAGSPVTYGPVLATYLAREILPEADRERYAKATAWLAQRKSRHIMETAVLARALRREEDIKALVAAQQVDGSWNGEPFDTALAMLALGPHHPTYAKGRAFLMKTQWSGGGWPATTRPAGGDSYAQHISTTAWVLISLLPHSPSASTNRAARLSPDSDHKVFFSIGRFFATSAVK